MASKIHSRVVNDGGQEQTVIVIIPDTDLKEALEEWAKHGTCFSEDYESIPINHRKSIARFLDDLDETVNPDGYGFEGDEGDDYI